MNDNEQEWESLLAVWQQHSDRIDQTVRHHDLSHLRLVPRRYVFSARKLRLSSLSVRGTVYMMAIGMIFAFKPRYVYDSYDFALMILLGTILLLSLATCAVSLTRLRKADPLAFLREGDDCRISHGGIPLRAVLSRAASGAAVAVLLLFLVLPVQKGRAMSQLDHGKRVEALDDVAHILNSIQ